PLDTRGPTMAGLRRLRHQDHPRDSCRGARAGGVAVSGVTSAATRAPGSRSPRLSALSVVDPDRWPGDADRPAEGAPEDHRDGVAARRDAPERKQRRMLLCGVRIVHRELHEARAAEGAVERDPDVLALPAGSESVPRHSHEDAA